MFQRRPGARAGHDIWHNGMMRLQRNDGERRNRFTAARLALQANRFAACQREAHAVHRLVDAVAGAEIGLEIFYLQQHGGTHAVFLRKGSMASRIASPLRMKANTVRKIAPPGNAAIHQLKVAACTARFSIWTPDGSSTRPSPRKLSVDSA